MVKANVQIRTEIMKSGLKNYEVGQRIGLTETRFSKLLKSDMSDADRERVLAAIRDLRTERGVTDVCNG